MSLIEFRGDAACAVAGCLKPPTTVWHHVSGVYAESDPHFCDAHRNTLRPEEVPPWTRGWEAGYARGWEARRNKNAAADGEVEYAECTCGHYPTDHDFLDMCTFVGCGCGS